MPLIDTHAHLYDDRLQIDFGDVLTRAQQEGLTAVITVGTTLADSRTCVQLAQTHDLLYATVGIHPNNAVEANPGDWDNIITLTKEKRVVGLGETGLDRHWDTTPFPVQQDYFGRHLALSRQTKLPVVIHCRKSEADVVAMLRADFDKNGPVRGVMHSFAADAATAATCLAMGLYISFAGMVTYKNARDLRDVVPKIPIDRILVETDCPYLAPVPLRGKRNEPAFVKHTAACVAELLGMTLEEFGNVSTANAKQLFDFGA